MNIDSGQWTMGVSMNFNVRRPSEIVSPVATIRVFQAETLKCSARISAHFLSQTSTALGMAASALGNEPL